MNGCESTTEAVGRFFDGYAENFDAIYGHTNRRGRLGRWIDRRFRKVMRLRFDEALRCVREAGIESILDVGCGPGRYIASFADAGVRVTGIDLADGMIGLARDLVGERPGVELIAGDYLKTEFEEPFDAACLMGFFDYVRNPEDVINKVKVDVRKEFYGSFPKSKDPLALQRRVRYKLRGCPLYMYECEDVKRLMVACGISEFEIKDLGRDLFLRATLHTE